MRSLDQWANSHTQTHNKHVVECFHGIVSIIIIMMMTKQKRQDIYWKDRSRISSNETKWKLPNPSIHLSHLMKETDTED